MNNLAESIMSEQIEVCSLDELVTDSGVCALVQGMQVAIFKVSGGSSGKEAGIYAISNRDPIGKANVLSRGIVGDVGGELVVASPLYKQHFSLTTGQCLEDEGVSVPVYKTLVEDNKVYVLL